MIGPHSPKITLPEKAALRAIEEGAQEAGVSSFLAASFMQVRQALAPHFEEVDLNAILALRLDDVPELVPVKKVFWEGEDLTAWGELFLNWEEEALTDSELRLGLEEINEYLHRSVEFYDSLDGDFRGAESELEVDSPEVLFQDLDSERFHWPRQNTLEGSSWDTIRVEKIYWPRPKLEEEPVERVVERADGAGEFGGSSWDSIKIETIYWPKKSEQPIGGAPPDESGEHPPTQALEIGYPMGPGQAAGRLESPPPVLPEEKSEPARVEAAQPPSRPVPEFDDGEELLTARAPSDPFRGSDRLVVKNKYLGYGKNAQGIMGLCGQLNVSYFKEGELSGSLESSNPLLFLSSKRLSGKRSVVTYWLPPVAFPHPAGHLVVKTPLETKTLALHTLFPQSRTDLMRDRSVVLSLFLPALIGFLYFAFVYVLTAHGINQEAQQTFPDLYRAALAGVETGDFRSQGLGLYRLRVIPASESMQMIWAAVILLAPLVSSKFFYYLSRRRKRQFGGVLAAAQLMPTVLLLSTWSFQDRVFPLYSHQDFAPLDLRGFLLWSVVMNLLVACYLFLSVFGFWDKAIKRSELRFALPFLLTGLYLLTMFVVIYGRSWFS
ncbi:MAG: hypothetical protein WC314_11700 [Vulcanimicrobiota bacterium]